MCSFSEPTLSYQADELQKMRDEKSSLKVLSRSSTDKAQQRLQEQIVQELGQQQSFNVEPVRASRVFCTD